MTAEFDRSFAPRYPVRVELRDSDGKGPHPLGAHRSLSVEETEELIADLEDALQAAAEAAEGHVVQVRIGSRNYSYRDPSRSLAEGDRVLVPFGYGNELRSAEVVGFGRGTWRGPLKDVNARLLVEELA